MDKLLKELLAKYRHEHYVCNRDDEELIERFIRDLEKLLEYHDAANG